MIPQLTLMTLMDSTNETIQDEPIDLRKKSALDRELQSCTTPEDVRCSRMIPTALLPPEIVLNELPYKASNILQSALLKTLSEYYFISLPLLMPGILMNDSDKLSNLNKSLNCSPIPVPNIYVQRSRSRSVSDEIIWDREREFVLPTTGVSNRSYSNRSLTGKYIKYGTGAKMQTLIALRKAIAEKQKGKETDNSSCASNRRKFQRKPEKKSRI